MFPNSSSTEVAVSHYSNWSATNWVLAYLLLASTMLLVSLAVIWAIGAEQDGGRFYVASAAVGVLAATIQAVTLWLIARHADQFKWVVALALLVVAVTALAVRQRARSVWSVMHASDYYAPPVPTLLVAVPAGISAVIAVGVLIGDGANRLAASVPMAVGAFVALVVLVVVGGGAYAVAEAQR